MSTSPFPVSGENLPSNLQRPRDRRRPPSAPVRRRRVIVIAVALAVVVVVVAAIVVIPRLDVRGNAVTRYEKVTAELSALRADIDPEGVDPAPLATLDTALISDATRTALSSVWTDIAGDLGTDAVSALGRAPLDVATASTEELDAESATLEAARAELTQLGDADLSAAATRITAAWDTVRSDVAAGVTGVFGDYSDAARSTEDALYAAAQAVASAPATDLAVAVTAAQAAADAVIADANAYRAELVASTSGTHTQPTGGDVGAQMAYLLKYWETYNEAEWGNVNPYGGDCVNFTSQGLLMRGWKMDDVWSSPGGERLGSKAWISTTAMEAYLKKLGMPSHTVDDLDRVRVGDVGIFDWVERGPGVDHTMTVSKVEYVPGEAPKVYFVSHNADGDYRELMYTLYEQHTDSIVRIYSIA